MPSFDGACPAVLTLSRPTLPGPLYVGVAPLPQEPLEGDHLAGATIIAGLDASAAGNDGAFEFLFVRCI